MRPAWLAWPLVFFSWGVGQAQAATPSVKISPALNDIILTEEGEVRKLPFSVTNETPAAVTVDLSVVDFGSLGETGGLAFIGEEDNSWTHRLANWLSLDQSRISIPAGATATVSVRLENRSDLTPGGHYAAVLATMSDGLTSGDKTKIGWQGVVSSQFYVLKKGGESYDLQLLSVQPTGFVWRQPDHIALRWRAAGNTHVRPYGEVVITTGRNQIVAKGVINEDSAIILPESTRVLDVALTEARWWPGRYTITVNYHHQATEETQTFTTTVWYFPVWLVGLLLLLLLILVRRKRRA